MGSLPPVPGTEMMGPPGGTGSLAWGGGWRTIGPAARANATPGQPRRAWATTWARARTAAWVPEPATTSSRRRNRHRSTPSARARTGTTRSRWPRSRRSARTLSGSNEDRLAKIESDFKIHQDEDRRPQEKQAEDARHNVQLEAIERERIQADKDIQAMKDATEIKVKQMEAGNQIYLGSRASRRSRTGSRRRRRAWTFSARRSRTPGCSGCRA